MPAVPRLTTFDADAIEPTLISVEQPALIWTGPLSRPSARNLYLLAMLVSVGSSALLVDVPLSRAAFAEKGLHKLHGVLESFEPFGQPTAILMTAGALLLCSARLRPAVPRLLCIALGAGLAANVVKLLLARTRPRSFDWNGGVLTTFHEFFPGLGRGSSHQSCPSSHTATAMGFALALASLFPEGRWLFFGAASLVALQRIECGAHFLSDTCWGAAVGYAVALVVLNPRGIGGWFSRQEGLRWRRGVDPTSNATLHVVSEDGPTA